MNVSTVQDPATPAQHLSPAEQEQIDAWWRAANYLSVGQIYLGDNPLLRAPLKREHLKPRLLGHWGTIPGLNFIYAHLNRAIKAQDLDMVYIAGPGHGVPSLVANAYLEGRYSELYPHISRDADGLRRLFQQFSCPGGIPGFASPQTPGAVQQGGELGYALSHAYGVVFDHPGLIAACVVGDGEAETGPLAAAWHSNKFLDPAHDGAVLPILHLNGHKTATPAVLARVGRDELASLFVGYGHRPYFVEGDDPAAMHQHMAAALDAALADIRAIQQAARAGGAAAKPLWPMIVLRTPKGWTGPKKVEGQPTEGNWRSHKTPIAEMDNPSHVKQLESWLQSYRPDELFDKHGCLLPEIAALAPQGRRRMSANPVANGGISLKDLNLPELREYAVAVKRPGHALAESTRAVGKYLRDTLVLNRDARNFRLFSPDEASANHLAPVFEVTDRVWQAQALPGDAHLATEGRVMEILCEHTCQGWLEGYLLSGRHGLFACHEAFAHIVDSMLSQHANWLKAAAEVPWRRPLASLNYLLASHVWRQEHPGDPGFIDHVANKKGAAIRVYLPPDANTLLLVTDRCLRSRDCINVIVACEQPQPQYLAMDAAVKH
ncbi:MAG: phosphoketolase, partial [Candidatus Methylumidiphilus sp.]